MGEEQSELAAAVAAVEDPLLRRSVGELGMLREVAEGRRRTRVVLAVPADPYPAQEELESRVRGAVAARKPGVRLDLDVETMDAVAVAALGAQLHGPGDPGGDEPKRNPFADRATKTRVLGIASGKGGVGKSSVTVNLAVALARDGFDVGLLDADVYGFSVPRMLGVDREPVMIGDLLVPPVTHGVRCMSMGFLVNDDQPIVWRGPMLHKALEQFLVDVYWGEPDFLVVDMPPGTGDVALSLAQYMPRTELYVVTTPQPAAQRVAQRSAYMARQVKLPVRGVIENMSWFTGDDGVRYEIFGAGGGAELAETLGVPLLAQVPLVSEVRVGGDEGVPVALADPRSGTGTGEGLAAFAALAERIVALGPTRVYRSELAVR